MLTTHKLPDVDDTIVALSSAVGPGARGIVRLSGQRATAVVSAVSPAWIAPLPGHFFAGNLRLSCFAAPIAADIYYFAAPRSYTGQDVVELHTLSCGPILDALITDCLQAGARAALAGEFTMRAFLAGKLDLTRAEAVLGVIEAADRNQLKQALSQLAGGMAQPLQSLREDLLNLLADVEAGLDFTEEDIHFISDDDLLKRIGRGLAHLIVLRKQLDQRALGQRPFRVVLAGKPNAGKSSLFNALAGESAALVSAEPGTTRDYLQCVIDLDGTKIELVDTAGLGTPTDAIDQESQSLGQQQHADADLVLWCVPCDEPMHAASASWVPIATKCDRVTDSADNGEPSCASSRVMSATSSPSAEDIAARGHPAPYGARLAGMLATSAATGAGLPELKQRLLEEVRRTGHAPLAPSVSRCKHHVEASLQHLRNAHGLVIEQQLPELLALELRLAIEEVGAMVGAVYTDDLLDRVFSRFCIGK